VLGAFRVERVGIVRSVSDWQRRSAKTLTKLLATTPGHTLHREQVLDIVWPGVDIESALNSFGKALYAARRAFEPDLNRRENSAYFRLTDSMLVLDTEHVTIDANRFERLAEDALRRREITAYEAALKVYGGELLPEDRYEDWCAERRSFLGELQIRLLLGLANALEARGSCGQAGDRLREVLQQDPTRETVHRDLMRLYAETGTPDQAIRQFRTCEEALRRDLGLAPDQKTVSLYRDVLASRIHRRGPMPELDSKLVSLHRPLAAGPTPGGSFVGRERLVLQMCDVLMRGGDGRPGMMLVTGEEGVGKTRLLEAFAGQARRAGAVVFQVDGGAHSNQFVSGPFALALEDYAASRTETERNELAQRYPALARFVPSLAGKAQNLTIAGDPTDCRLDFFPAIVRLLTHLSDNQPVLFILGDLHPVDPLSLDLLGYLAQLAVRRPWLMVGAAREEEVGPRTKLRRALEGTIREGRCLRIELPCLARTECDQLVRALLPASRSGERLLEQIYTRSRGNPLFVRELVREMRERGDPALTTGSLDESSLVSAHVRALTAMRMSALNESLRRVLGLAASATTTEISLSELRAGAAELEPPISDAALFSALDNALRLHILEERNTGYAFRHPLVCSAVYEGLSRHRRDEFHAALAGPKVRNARRLSVSPAG
jgi:DNA-binding SARP family transcriptional activator